MTTAENLIWEKNFRHKHELVSSGQAAFIYNPHVGSGRQLFVFNHLPSAVERVRWKQVERLNKILKDVYRPAFNALYDACPCKAVMTRAKHKKYSDGTLVYSRSDVGKEPSFGFSWKPWVTGEELDAPLNQPVVDAWVKAESVFAVNSMRLTALDSLLSHFMFPRYGVEESGKEGLTRFIVNGRSYLATRRLNNAGVCCFEKFVYPGSGDNAYEEVTCP